MAQSKSSRRWLHDHAQDPYVIKARKDGYRSRAVFKLEEIDQKDRLIKPGMLIVDLGAAPGGWSQWVQRKLNGRATILALDILPMDALPQVEFIQGDFTAPEVHAQLLGLLRARRPNLVMSDMAPNISGMKAVDQPRAMLLAESARDFALEFLMPGGDFLCKVFQGEGADAFILSLRTHFRQVSVRKPKSSKPQSREVYASARGFRV